MSKKWYHDEDDHTCPASASDWNECTCALKPMTLEAINERYCVKMEAYEQRWEIPGDGPCKSHEYGLITSQEHRDIGTLLKMVGEFAITDETGGIVNPDSTITLPIYEMDNLMKRVEAAEQLNDDQGHRLGKLEKILNEINDLEPMNLLLDGGPMGLDDIKAIPQWRIQKIQEKFRW
jgi:hypothetical protein